jgi:hypothetical protein
MTPNSRSLKEQHARSQETLVAFLQTDLNLSFTMLTTAQLDVGRTSDQDHYHAALNNVRQALLVIRSLEGRIEDRKSWKAVHDRTDELERQLNSFPE